MLETRELTKVYHYTILSANKLNLKAEHGEISVVFGANGAGKAPPLPALKLHCLHQRHRFGQ